MSYLLSKITKLFKTTSHHIQTLQQKGQKILQSILISFNSLPLIKLFYHLWKQSLDLYNNVKNWRHDSFASHLDLSIYINLKVIRTHITKCSSAIIYSTPIYEYLWIYKWKHEKQKMYAQHHWETVISLCINLCIHAECFWQVPFPPTSLLLPQFYLNSKAGPLTLAAGQPRSFHSMWTQSSFVLKIKGKRWEEAFSWGLMMLMMRKRV